MTGVLNKAASACIHFYRRFLSPLFGQNKCKYYPSCSAYGLEAFARYRFLTALSLTVWRILRCNPFSHGGFDPLR